MRVTNNIRQSALKATTVNSVKNDFNPVKTLMNDIKEGVSFSRPIAPIKFEDVNQIKS